MLNLYIGSIAGTPIFREATIDEKKWLLSQLTNRMSRMRWNAACELGKCQYKESVNALIIALQDKHWLVRLHAAQALGRIGDKKAFEPLKERLQDNCPYVQRRVIIALGKLGDASIIPILLKVAQTDDHMFSYPVYQALSNFMSQNKFNALMRALSEFAYRERMHKTMKTYKNEKYGFEIDLSDEWSVYSGTIPLLPTILFTIANGWIPKADIEFSTGSNEYLNIVVEIIKPEPPPQFLEHFFSQYAQQMNFTDCVYGRIVVSQKEHVWARYQMHNNVWCKKFMIILNGVGYAITASCAGKEMFIQRESIWDEIAKSLRLSKPEK